MLQEHRSPSNLTSPSQALKLARILWIACVVPHLFYFALVPIVINDAGAEASMDLMNEFLAAYENPAALGLTLAAVVALVMSSAFPAFFKRSRNTAKDLTVVQALQTDFTAFVCSLALNESVALMGFVGGAMILKNLAFGYAFIGLSLFAMILRFPNITLFEKPRQIAPGVRIG